METGRVNQKRRTRAAIVAAAQELLTDGRMPTVAEAAAGAGVGRTTAYRYFPTQESLLLELTVTASVTEIEDLVARPVDADTAAERLVEVLQAFNRTVLGDEVRYRTAARLYQDQWLAAHAEGEDAPVFREGRRQRWFTAALAPLVDAGRLRARDLDRLLPALSMLCGAEAVIVLRDVCRLDEDDALAVTEWAAHTLLQAALDEASA